LSDFVMFALIDNVP